MPYKRINILGVLLGSILLAECSKPSTQPKESFYLYGYLTDFTTGSPLSNMKVTAQGQTASSGGMFGTPSVTYNLGETTTDNNGYFKIAPLKINGITYFYVLPENNLKYISFFQSITADSIQKTLLSGYDLSYSLNSYAYLKINFNDTSAPDSADVFSLDVMCPGNVAGPGFNPNQDTCYPLPLPTEIDLFKGAIKNGFAIYTVLGNTTNGISYTKTTKSGFGPNLGGKVYCKANDTTYYTIKY